MMKNQAPTLVEIARAKAAEGKGWDALTAHLAADAYVLSEALAKNPKVLLDVGSAWKLNLDSDQLKDALEAYRASILESLTMWDLAVPVRKQWASLDSLPETVLEPEGVGAFAADLLKHRDVAGFIANRRRRAAHSRLLAVRLFRDGDIEGALRCAKASELAVFTAHHTIEAQTAADPSLAIVRTALMLAEHETSTLDETADPGTVMENYRLALTRATATEEPVPWEKPYFLS